MSPSSLRGVLMAGMKPFAQLSYEELLADGQAVVGSPASVTARLRELHAELGGFGQLIGLFAIGPSTHEQVTRSAELFASEVIPALRSLGAGRGRGGGFPGGVNRRRVGDRRVGRPGNSGWRRRHRLSAARGRRRYGSRPRSRRA